MTQAFIISKITNIFGYEINKFRLGQIFFISGITFGLFWGDGLRRILFIAALVCLSGSQRKEKFYKSWTKGQRIAGCSLIFFCLWMLFIPLFFGIEPFWGRVQGIFRPLELFIIMWEAIIFAKDDFFFNSIKNFAIVTCFVYSVLAIGQRFMLGFSVNFENWIITVMAWRVGALLSGLLPWAVYDFIMEKSRIRVIFLAVVIILTCGTMFLTLYTTFWLVLIVQFTAAFILVSLFYRKRLLRILSFIVVALAIMWGAVYGISAHYNSFRDSPGGFMSQLEQITCLGDKFEISKFTNRRSELWSIAIELIKKRPLFGYGWANGELVSDKIGHMHNSYLQSAWNAGLPATVMYIALLLMLSTYVVKAIVSNRKIVAVPFVVFLVFLAYLVCGVLDDMFRSQLTIMTLYLSVFMLPLSPLAKFTRDI